MYCMYTQDDTESSGVALIQNQQKVVHFSQTINIFEKVNYDLNTLFKIQFITLSAC